jgi:hypothetical protein
MLLAALVVIWVRRHRGHPVKTGPWAAFWAGMTATIAANLAVARAYAGHKDRANSAGTTTTYVRADVEEIAAALTALTGEPHPIAPPVRNDEQGHRRG